MTLGGGCSVEKESAAAERPRMKNIINFYSIVGDYLDYVDRRCVLFDQRECWLNTITNARSNEDGLVSDMLGAQSQKIRE